MFPEFDEHVSLVNLSFSRVLDGPRTRPAPAAARQRAMMSSSFRRRMTWQQSLCVAPVIQLPPSERLAK